MNRSANWTGKSCITSIRSIVMGIGMVIIVVPLSETKERDHQLSRLLSSVSCGWLPTMCQSELIVNVER